MSADIEQNNGGDFSQLQRIHPNSLANLKRFEPGQSGNPRGFPKGLPRFDHTCARLVLLSPEERAVYKPKNAVEESALSLINRGIEAGDRDAIKYLKELMDRTDGPVAKRIENVGNVAESEQNGLLAKALELIARLIEQRGITEAEARSILAEKAPTLAGYLEGEVVGE